MLDDVPHLLVPILFFTAHPMPVAGRVFACVFNTYARHRTNAAKFTIGHIDFSLCTHYIYYRATLNPVIKKIVPDDPAAEMGVGGLYTLFNDAKRTHPGVKTLLTVGGDEPDVSLKFKGLFEADMAVHIFAVNAVDFLRQHNFDGINLFWNPGIITKNLTRLLLAFRLAIDNELRSSSKLILTFQAHAKPWYIQAAYDATQIGRLVDYVLIMAYLFASPGSEFARFNGPLFAPSDKNFNQLSNVNASVHTWFRCGLTFQKMVLGVSAVASFVRLLHPTTQFRPGAPTASQVLVGEVYFFQGGLAYSEVCSRFMGSSKYWASFQKNPYLVRVYEWVGYEDHLSLFEKITYVQFMGLAGMMFNNMDEDDFQGKECRSGHFPLISYIKNNLDFDVVPTPVTTDITRKATLKTTTTRLGTTSTIRTTRGGIPSARDPTIKILTTSPSADGTGTAEVHTSPELVPGTNTMPPQETAWNATTTEGYPTGTHTFKPTTVRHDSKHVMFYVLLVLSAILGYGLGSLFMGYIRRKDSRRHQNRSS